MVMVIFIHYGTKCYKYQNTPNTNNKMLLNNININVDNKQPINIIPTLSIDDITDRDASLVADPFMCIRTDSITSTMFKNIQERNQNNNYNNQVYNYYLFFEILSNTCQKGEIGAAIWDNNIDKWEYIGVVLTDKTHLSFPYVFEIKTTKAKTTPATTTTTAANDGYWYLIFENHKNLNIPLYRTTRLQFPLGWKFVLPLIDNIDAVDSVIYHYNDKCYIFTSVLPSLNF